jgi:hypothetical protein
MNVLTKVFGEASLSLRTYVFIYLHHRAFTSSEEINLQQMDRVCLHASTTWQQLVSIQDFDNELLLP